MRVNVFRVCAFFALLRLHSVRVPISAPRLCLYEFRVPIPVFYAIFLYLFAMFVNVTFSVYIPFLSLPRAYGLVPSLLAAAVPF